MQPCWMGVGFLIDIAPMDEMSAGEHPSVWNVVAGVGGGGADVELDGSSDGAVVDSSAAGLASDGAVCFTAGRVAEAATLDVATLEGSWILDGTDVNWIGSASGDSDRDDTSVWSPYCPSSESRSE